MKRLATQPITAFFERKRPRLPSVESVASDSDASAAAAAEEAAKPPAASRRAPREDLTSLLQRREVEGCASSRPLIGARGPRRRKQQLVRWALTHLRRLPLQLQLAPHWERQAGALSSESFYASCLEFDAQGVLLAAGASNGIVALFDFDDVFHRSLNLGQKMQREQGKDVTRAATEGENAVEDEILHPIHTIFTHFEVKCIRWNPSNEDEIACSFTNRNEIHIFNLRKFPSKPHKILKSSNHPSSGYNDLLYLPATEPTVSNSRQLGTTKMKPPRAKTCNIVAGDMDGAIRMWDTRFPMRPVWSFLSGSQPINSLILSPNKQFLIFGNEAGMIMTYDIQNNVVPAFGSKPVPQRKASLNIMEAIKPYLSPACIEEVLLTCRSGSPGIISLRLEPRSETQVLCQLRNGWVVSIDYLHGSVVKLHTPVRGLMPREKSKSEAAPSVLTTPSDNDYQRDFLSRSLRNSWLSCHRCVGTFLYDNSIMCTGIHDATSLNVIDLHQLRRNNALKTGKAANSDEVGGARPSISGPDLPAVERLDRFRIPMTSIVTAVAAHPSQHSVICGGENMKLQVMGVMGHSPRTTASS